MSEQSPGDLTAILLVEDNPTDAHLMKAIIEQAGDFEVTTATDGDVGAALIVSRVLLTHAVQGSLCYRYAAFRYSTVGSLGFPDLTRRRWAGLWRALDAPLTDGHLALERSAVLDMHPPGLDLARNLARRLKLKIRFGVYRTDHPPCDYRVVGIDATLDETVLADHHGLPSPNVATDGALDPKRTICLGISLYRHTCSDDRDCRLGWRRRRRIGLSHIGRSLRAARGEGAW